MSAVNRTTHRSEEARQVAAVVLRAVRDEEVDHCDETVVRRNVKRGRAVVGRDAYVCARLYEAPRHVGVPVQHGEEERSGTVRRGDIQIDLTHGLDETVSVLEKDLEQYLHDRFLHDNIICHII